MKLVHNVIFTIALMLYLKTDLRYREKKKDFDVSSYIIFLPPHRGFLFFRISLVLGTLLRFTFFISHFTFFFLLLSLS